METSLTGGSRGRPAAEPARAGGAGRYFYTVAGLFVIAAVALGFGRSFYLRPMFNPENLGPGPLLVLHGVLMSTWMVFFVVQAWLVSARRVAVHRRLGWFGAAVGLAVVVVGFTVAVSTAAAGRAPPGAPPLVFMVVPLGDVAVFGTLVGLGLWWRRAGDVHKRLILLGTLSTLPAAIARFPFDFFRQGGPLVYFGGCDLIVLAFVGWDSLAHRRLHPAFRWGGLFLVLSHPLRLAIGSTAAWESFARWLVEGFAR